MNLQRRTTEMLGLTKPLPESRCASKALDLFLHQWSYRCVVNDVVAVGPRYRSRSGSSVANACGRVTHNVTFGITCACS